MKEKSESEILISMASYCSLTERCIDDVVKKIRKTAIDESASQRIIKKLVDENYINEERFCRSFINDKLRFNQWGKIKLKYELKQRNISPDLYNEALENIEPDVYNEILTSIIRKKLKNIKEKNNHEIFRKLLRHAAGKGFEPDLIYKTIAKIINYTEDE